MAIETVAVTGGSGKVGRRILAELTDKAYQTANLDIQSPKQTISDSFIRTDLLEAGEVYGAITKTDADAVVHMGTLPHPNETPGYVTFENNVMTSYHVLEASVELGVEAVCLPSSINAIGHAFQNAPEIEYLPVDETHPATPRDPYGLGKRVIEVTADGFGRSPDSQLTISSLRYPYAATTDELREFYVDTDRSLAAMKETFEIGDNPLFEYVHVDDIARAARLAVEADHCGHETFWIVANETTVTEPTETVIEVFYPDTELKSGFSGRESLITPRKARERLGWKAMIDWRELC